MNWQQFLASRSIPTSRRGHTAGWIGIQCPWCGGDDAGFHLGISPSGGFNCWRNPQHKGRNPARLVAALLHCSQIEAARLIGQRHFPSDDFQVRVRALLAPEPVPEAPSLALPPEFRAISSALPSARPFQAHLVRSRGYPMAAIGAGLNLAHGLLYAIQGPFAYRIIFPVHLDGRLATWTGRAIGDHAIRYKTLSPDPEKARAEGSPVARGKITDFLLWHDELRGGEVLVVCEGPFDALRVRWLGQRLRVMATCSFTARISEAQIDLLHEVAPRYRRRILLFDHGTVPTMLRYQSILSSLDFTYKILPPGVKDPGEIGSTQQLRDILLA